MALGWASRRGTRVALFEVDGVPQPTLLMIHREMAPYLTEALAQGRYKLFPELKVAAENLGRKHEPGWQPEPGLQGRMPMMQFSWTDESKFSGGESFPKGFAWSESTPAQEAGVAMYFANLNTPEEFAEAEKHLDVLDT
jgi:molybdopterin-guanine dinucleotide biosynthesis protein A